MNEAVPIVINHINGSVKNGEHDQFFCTMNDLRTESNISLKLMNNENITETETNKCPKNEFIDKFHATLMTLQNNIDTVWCHSEFILLSVESFDFKDIKANGYRSFIEIVRRCSAILLIKLRLINAHSVPIKWNKTTVSDISAFCECLHELSRCLYLLSALKRLNDEGSLISRAEIHNSVEMQHIIDESDKLRPDVFFGHCIGFYYCNSAQRILLVLGSIMSGYAHSFITHQSGFRGVFNTLLKSVTSFWNPEDRGKLMAMITRNATIDFTKQFWNLGEHPLVLEAPNIILPPVEVAVNFDLPPVPFTVPIKSTDPSCPSEATIHPPADGANRYSTKPIKLRLISFHTREGLSWLHQTNSGITISQDKSFINSFNKQSHAPKERSTNLVIHCHGGGFVAQSAKSHDIYLRSWAQKLDCPILSIDYSLAPEYPYPRAIDECFYGIAWAIRNRRQLGCTEDAKIVLCGDSAGANLTLCATLKAIKLGLTVPDALFFAYIPVLIAMTPSPARLISLIDPLLPVGILIRCLLAYAGIDENVLVSSMSQLSTTATSKNSPIDSNTATNQSDFLSDPKDIESQHFLPLRDSVNETISSLSIIRHAEMPQDPFLSPLLIDDETLSKLPPTSIISSQCDPLLDDCVELCKRIDKVGVPISFKVVDDVPHGFLNFVLVSRECEAASQECVKMIGLLFDKSRALK